MSTSHGNFFSFTLAASSLLGLMMTLPATAQLPLEADDTLGGESSLVVPIGGFPGFFVIEGGATRESNLFHSFEEFNVNENGGVVFADPAAIDNVIARVTGDNPSNILGALGMFNDANLFLLNPNGIFFGENAQLLMEGSFLASTADSLIFPDDLDFSAANPDPNALLSINVPIGLQFGNQPAPITNEAFLNLAADRSLVLAGGPVTLDNGALSPAIPNDTETLSGRVEVAAIGAAGRVDLAVDGSDLALRLPETLPRADIILQNNSFIGAIGNGGGAIALYGNNVSLRDASRLSLGIGRDLGNADNQLGRIRVNATGQMVLSGGSIIQSGIFAGGVGSGGPIRINATELDVQEGSSIITFSNGSGDAGDIRIRARDRLLLTGTNAMGNQRSRITSVILTEGIGTSGTIDLETAVLRIGGGAALSTELRGTGEAGAISIRASDRLLLTGTNAMGNQRSRIGSITSSEATGTSGTIDIDTAVLRIGGGAVLSTELRGTGEAGAISIRASDRLLLIGTNAMGDERSRIRSITFSEGIGTVGTIEIDTAVLRIEGGAALSTELLGTGEAGAIAIRASDRVRVSGVNEAGNLASSIASFTATNSVGSSGNISITTRALEVLDRANILTSSAGRGNGGNIYIQASDRVLISDTPTDEAGTNSTLISTNTLPGSVGRGGNIDIQTTVLEMQNGARISTTINGRGDGGNLRFQAAERIRFSDSRLDGLVPTQASTGVNRFGNGNAGRIEIRTPVLELLDGSSVITNTEGRGSAGRVVIRASDRIRLAGNAQSNGTGSFISSTVGNTAVGDGNNIAITTPILEVQDGGRISADTSGRGNAGNVIIRAANRIFLSGTRTDRRGVSRVSSNVIRGAVGRGGNVEIITGVLEVQDGAQISASTFGQGNAGNVIIRARDLARFTGRSTNGNFASGAFSNVQSTANGNGGNVRITTSRLEVRDGARISASTFGQGNAGNIIIRARDLARFTGRSANGNAQGGASTASSSVQSTANGNGGNVRITTSRLEVRDEAQINTGSFGRGNAGNVVLRAHDRVILSGTPIEDQRSIAVSSSIQRSGVGQGGDVIITTPFLEVSGGAAVSASTVGRGSAGNVFVNTDRTLVRGIGDIQSGVAEGARGDGGNVEIRTRILQLRSGGQIITSTQAEGDAGDVIVRAGDRLTISSPQSDSPQRLSGIFSQVTEGAIGNGGTIDIRSPFVDIDNGGLSSQSRGEGIGGNIFVTADRLQLDDRAQIDTQTLSTDGGNIALAIDDLLILRNNSLISTEAGNAQSGGDGGDITINNSDGFIVAVPEENSDIVANAFEGRGGNIRITTQGIFGLEFRDERTPLSDITASSEIGVDGDVEIITPNLDPTQGLVALPTDVVDAADQIGQVCPTGPGAAAQLGRFVMTGRGGISPSPVEILDEADIELDWLDDDTPQGEPRESVPQSQHQPSPLVEADSWARSADGALHLVATAPDAEGAIAPSLQPCP